MIVVACHSNDRGPGVRQAHNTIVKPPPLLKRRGQAVENVSGDHHRVRPLGDREINDTPPGSKRRDIEIDLVTNRRDAPEVQVSGAEDVYDSHVMYNLQGFETSPIASQLRRIRIADKLDKLSGSLHQDITS